MTWIRRDYQSCFSWRDECVSRLPIFFCTAMLERPGPWGPLRIISCPHSHVLGLEVRGVECNVTPRTGVPLLFQLFGA